MDISQFNPYVRYIDKRRAGSEYKEPVAAYDHRLFFVSSGSLKIFLSDRETKLSEGQSIIIPPGVGYRLFPENESEYYVLNFDFIFDSALTHLKPVCPDTLSRFRPEKIISAKTCSIFPMTLSCAVGSSEKFNTMLMLFTKKEYLYAEYVSALLKAFVTEAIVFTHYDRTPENIKNLLSYLSKHYLEHISNSDIAEAFSFHPNHLGRIFKEYTGKTLHSHVVNLRLQKAHRLLLTTTLPVSEISELCSFESNAYFIKSFKKHFGSSPGKLRRENSRML